MKSIRHALFYGWLVIALSGCQTMQPLADQRTTTISQEIRVGDAVELSTQNVETGYFLRVTAISNDFLEGRITALGNGFLEGKHPEVHDLVRVPLAHIVSLKVRRYDAAATKATLVIGVLIAVYFAIQISQANQQTAYDRSVSR